MAHKGHLILYRDQKLSGGQQAERSNLLRSSVHFLFHTLAMRETKPNLPEKLLAWQSSQGEGLGVDWGSKVTGR